MNQTTTQEEREVALAPEFDRTFMRQLCALLGVTDEGGTVLAVTIKAKTDDVVRVTIERAGFRADCESLLGLLKRKGQELAEAPKEGIREVRFVDEGKLSPDGQRKIIDMSALATGTLPDSPAVVEAKG